MKISFEWCERSGLCLEKEKLREIRQRFFRSDLKLAHIFISAVALSEQKHRNIPEKKRKNVVWNPVFVFSRLKDSSAGHFGLLNLDNFSLSNCPTRMNRRDDACAIENKLFNLYRRRLPRKKTNDKLINFKKWFASNWKIPVAIEQLNFFAVWDCVWVMWVYLPRLSMKSFVIKALNCVTGRTEWKTKMERKGNRKNFIQEFLLHLVTPTWFVQSKHLSFVARTKRKKDWRKETDKDKTENDLQSHRKWTRNSSFT